MSQSIIGSSGFKILFSSSVFLAALWLLRHEMNGISLKTVGSAIGSTRPTALLLAGLTTVISYGCLAVSEWWSVRTVGRSLSARRIGLVTLVSYSLSNSLGFSVATGAAARLRLYRGWGLSTAEAAAVTVLAGLAVTLSGLVTAGAALVLVPNLPAAFVALAILLLFPAAFWLLRFPSRLWFLPGGTLTSAPLRQRLFALAGGVADWVFSGLALFVLLPGASAADFLPFLAIFVLGSVLSAASGVPGGIGVFDAVVLALSRQFAMVHETAAALVVYRIVYALGPLLITAAGLSAGQARRLLKGRAGSELRTLVDLFVPPVLALLVFYLGAGLLMAAANAPVRLSTPLAVGLPRSALLSSVTGALLVTLASGLWRRQEAAYYVALALLLGGAGAEVWRGFGWASAGPLLLIALLLAPSRFAFDRRSAAFRDLASPGWMIAIALAGAAALVLARVGVSSAETFGRPWWSLVIETGRSGALSFTAGMAALALVLALWRLLAPARPATPVPSAEDLAHARQVIEQAGAVSCDAFLALMGDKAIVFSPSGRSFVMYRPWGSRWIAMGDPVGPPDERPAAISAFTAAAEGAGAQPVFYAVEQETLPDLVSAGFATFKIGESASVRLDRFDLAGRDKEDLRHARNRAARLGFSFQVYPADAPDTPWDELARVSSAWLSLHAGVEKGFSLGAFDVAYLKNFPIAVLRDGAGVLAFANVVASPDRSKFGADLMRSRRDGPHGAMDAFFLDLIGWGREQGYARFELGMAPLSGLEGADVESWSRRIERWIYHGGEPLYGFEGLRAFKEKFSPEWRPMFLAGPPGGSPLSLLTEVALLTSGGAKGLARRPKAASSPDLCSRRLRSHRSKT